MKTSLSILISVLWLFVGVVPAWAINFADFATASLGSYWTYQNSADPTDIYTVSVFEEFVFDGNPAFKTGTDINNYDITYNDGTSLIYYASVEHGILYDTADVVFSEVTDGMFFQVAEPTNFGMIREWDNLDPAQKSIYGIDPSLNDLLLWVVYDSNYPSNSQNSIVESNLGISLPDYGVTQLSWMALDVGDIVVMDFSGEDGTFGSRYDLIDYNINTVPEPSTILLLGSGLAGMAALRRKFTA